MKWEAAKGGMARPFSRPFSSILTRLEKNADNYFVSKIPPIFILGYSFTIEVGDRIPLTADGMGKCDTYVQKIWINKNLHPQQIRSTLLHEILEAISGNLNLDLTEAQIRGIEVGLNSVTPAILEKSWEEKIL